MAQPNPSGGAPPNSNKISIITKSEIRYEGILYHINPQDQNITLCNVKSFGTEGRRPGDEIAPSPQVHEYIIFRGSDIKDLKVIETAQTQPEAPTTTTTQASQPVEQTAPKQQQQQPQPEEKQQQKMVQGQEDFDFQGMQEKFQQWTSEHKQAQITTKSYTQNDFFDSLSTSTAEKTREAPFDRIAQKKVDKETFGSEDVDNASHRGGRGGRGRGRGGHQGGGYRRGGGGNYRGGQNRKYGGGDGQHGGGYQQGGYGGHGGQGGYGGQGQNYGGQNRYQNRQHGGHQGGYNNQYGGGQNYNQGGGRYQNQQGNEGGYQQNSGPRYYKTYQNVNHDQTQQGGEEDRGGFRKY